ncbi:UNVERIFIED_ORG: hypothetical protein J2W85_005819 [Ensifer adhaerens]|nr:hypothetical protein [Ensifer adhaerens]
MMLTTTSLYALLLIPIWFVLWIRVSNALRRRAGISPRRPCFCAGC